MTRFVRPFPFLMLAGLSVAGLSATALSATGLSATGSKAETATGLAPDDGAGYAATAALAGKWTPEQWLEMDADWLAEQGLELPPEQFWSEDGGLLRAVVNIRGCTASFVSPQGLMLTNHHCVHSILQEYSTPERDLLRDGFVAPRLEDELPATNSWASIIHRLTDVTERIEASVPEGADDLERHEAIEAEKKKLLAQCEAQPRRRCRVATYDDGVRYQLIEAIEFTDVRLVYAPPRAVGEYGGEVDNWSWPRHTGDFALLRVYAMDGRDPADFDRDNEPYRPQVSLRLAEQGVKPGDLILVPGFPARSYRSWTADEVAERQELFLPRRSELYQDWLEILAQEAEVSEEASLALANRRKRLANREKNSRGQLAGLARADLLQHKRRAEQSVLDWAADRAAALRGDTLSATAVEAHAQLRSLVDEARQTWQRDFLLDQIESGPLVLDLALELVRASIEAGKPDEDRESGYQERDRSTLRRAQKRNQSQLHRPAEARLLGDLFSRLASLPEAQRPSVVQAWIDRDVEVGDPEAWLRWAKKLLTETQMFELTERLEMLKQTPSELRARGDSLLELAFELQPTLEEVEQASKRRAGAISRLRPAWRRAVAAHADKPVDQDANGTLRISLGRVQGYSPRDGVFMLPFTTLSGLAEKNTGEPPFDAPRAVLDTIDKTLEQGDVPVCFLGSADTTGGNSGSPVLNARGEVVGVNFDRVWENVANDFGYNPRVARQVSADARYLLWMLNEVVGADAARLVRELTAARSSVDASVGATGSRASADPGE